MSENFTFEDYEFFGENQVFHFVGDAPENLYSGLDFCSILNKHYWPSSPNHCFVYDQDDHTIGAVFEISYSQICEWIQISKYRATYGKNFVLLVFDDPECPISHEKNIVVRKEDINESRKIVYLQEKLVE
jgi:hypothetical protein